MSRFKIENSQKSALVIATALAVIIAVLFLKAYLILIITSAIVVVLFNPVYKWLLKKGRSPGQAAALTTLVSFLTVFIPLVLVSFLTVFQIEKLADQLSKSSLDLDFITSGQLINELNSWLAQRGADFQISASSVSDAISSAAQKFGTTVVEGILSSISGIFGLITASIIYLYVFISMLINQDKIMEVAKKLNPLGNKVSELYIQRMGAMTKATVRGQLIIAICQGTASAVALYIAGLQDLFFFFLMLLTVLSIIPLGAGIVTIPIGIIMILVGDVWQGVFVILNHLIIVTNIDNVLRPRLVPKEAKLDSALMILAVFAGIGWFGFLGIVIGPVLMIILVTTIQIYLEVFKDTKALNTGEVKNEGKRLFRKIRNWRKAV